MNICIILLNIIIINCTSSAATNTAVVPPALFQLDSDGGKFNIS